MRRKRRGRTGFGIMHVIEKKTLTNESSIPTVLTHDMDASTNWWLLPENFTPDSLSLSVHISHGILKEVPLDLYLFGWSCVPHRTVIVQSWNYDPGGAVRIRIYRPLASWHANSKREFTVHPSALEGPYCRRVSRACGLWLVSQIISPSRLLVSVEKGHEALVDASNGPCSVQSNSYWPVLSVNRMGIVGGGGSPWLIWHNFAWVRSAGRVWNQMRDQPCRKTSTTCAAL